MDKIAILGWMLIITTPVIISIIFVVSIVTIMFFKESINISIESISI